MTRKCVTWVFFWSPGVLCVLRLWCQNQTVSRKRIYFFLLNRLDTCLGSQNWWIQRSKLEWKASAKSFFECVLLLGWNPCFILFIHLFFSWYVSKICGHSYLQYFILVGTHQLWVVHMVDLFVNKDIGIWCLLHHQPLVSQVFQCYNILVERVWSVDLWFWISRRMNPFSWKQRKQTKTHFAPLLKVERRVCPRERERKGC